MRSKKKTPPDWAASSNMRWTGLLRRELQRLSLACVLGGGAQLDALDDLLDLHRAAFHVLQALGVLHLERIGFGHAAAGPGIETGQTGATRCKACSRRIEVRIRQLPGPQNALGQMKFVFPNAQGIFLHDTPERQLLSEASRLYSGGCIRLEDAPRFARWLFGRGLKKDGNAPEQIVPIPTLVPLYVTYLTAVPSGSSIAYFDDVYGLDAARQAALGSGPLASR